MTTKQYIKKCRLGEGVQYLNHNSFGIDFGTEFFNKLEYLKLTNTGYNHTLFIKHVDDMWKKWEQINLKIPNAELPVSVWYYLYYNIFLPTKDAEFPDIAEKEEIIRGLDIVGLKRYISNNAPESMIRYFGLGIFFKSDIVIIADYEWDRNYQENVIGSLGLKPSVSMFRLLEYFDNHCTDYMMDYAFTQLVNQSKRLAAAKAKIQFKIHIENKGKRKNHSKDDWHNYISNNNGVVRIDDYMSYFLFMRIDPDKTNEEEVNKIFKKMSMLHHPDKGGSHDKFLELVESKNKCIEFLKLSKR